MNIETTALKLIEYAYDATMAPDKWQVVIKKFVNTLGANTGILREANYTSGAVGLFSTVGYEPTLKQAYRDHFVHLDMFAPTLKHSAIGEMIHGDTAVPWSHQLKSEFYNDYMRPQGARYVLGATLARNSQHHLLFGLQRSKQQGDFTQEHVKLIQLVAPHIARAVQIHRQLQIVTTQQQWSLSALNCLKVGVILLNDRSQPVFVNCAAERLMTENGFVIADNGLRLTRPTDSQYLQRLITDVILSANNRGSNHGGSLSLQYTKPHIRIQVIPLPQNLSEQVWSLSMSDICVAVFITTASHTQLQSNKLALEYGLTPAEIKLTLQLVEGFDLETAASNLSVSIQTVRSQLKAIFAKTNVNRQTELILLLLSTASMDIASD